MSQNDFNLANQGFPSMRADMNSAFQALATNSAGSTEPSVTYPYQWWYDTSTDILKFRNADNDAWIDFATFDQTTDSWSFASVDINGGTIDGTVIGGSTPAAISGTTGTFSGDLTVDTSTLFVDASTNRVGIGTSSPSHELDVQSTGDTTLRVKAQSSGAGNDDDATLQIDAAETGEATLEFRQDGVVKATIDWFSAGNPDFNFRTEAGTNGVFDFQPNDSLAMRIDSSGNVGIGTSSPSATLDVNGSLSKNSGSFKIDHPVKPDTHHLVHSFVEGPQADNLYRGKVTLVNGSASVNLDEAGRMSEGTFVALNGNVQCWTTNEDGWTQVCGKVEGNTLTIEAQDLTCTDEVSWLVIGERHDQHMIDTEWTDENGRVITEPEKATQTEGAE